MPRDGGAALGGCRVGHTQRAMECPGCAEANGTDTDLAWWKWYRTRTMSPDVKRAVTAHIGTLVGIDYDGPGPSVECAYPPCTHRLRESEYGGGQWCSKEHRTLTIGQAQSAGTRAASVEPSGRNLPDRAMPS